MSERILKHFYEQVLTPYTEYVANRKFNNDNDSLLLAKNAATAIYHFDDLIRKDHAETKQRKKNFPDFRLLGDVVDALKHHRDSRESLIYHGSEGVAEFCVRIEYKDLRGLYYHEVVVVMVLMKDNTARTLNQIMTNVINYWSDLLRGNGLLEEALHFKTQGVTYVSREDAKIVPFELKGPYSHTRRFINLYHDSILNKLGSYGMNDFQITSLTLKPMKNGEFAVTNVGIHDAGQGVGGMEITQS